MAMTARSILRGFFSEIQSKSLRHRDWARCYSQLGANALPDVLQHVAVALPLASQL